MTDFGIIGLVWEVFNVRSGFTIGYARADHYEPAIAAVIKAAGIDDREIDADLVPVEALDRVPVLLPSARGVLSK